MGKTVKSVIDTGKTTGVALDPTKPTQVVQRKIYKVTTEEDGEVLRDGLLSEKARLEKRLIDIDLMLNQMPAE